MYGYAEATPTHCQEQRRNQEEIRRPAAKIQGIYESERMVRRGGWADTMKIIVIQKVLGETSSSAHDRLAMGFAMILLGLNHNDLEHTWHVGISSVESELIMLTLLFSTLLALESKSWCFPSRWKVCSNITWEHSQS
jgi:hypothetical protein